MIILVFELTIVVDARLGFLCYGVGWFAFLIYAIADEQTERQRFSIILLLIPSIRIINLSVPFDEIPIIVTLAFDGLLTLLIVFLFSRKLALNLPQLGLKPTVGDLRSQTLVALSGFPLGWLGYYIFAPQPLMTLDHPLQWLLITFMVVIGIGMPTELIFRGVMLRVATEYLGPYGVVFIAVIYAILHIGYGSLFVVLYVLVLGLYFSWIVIKTKCIVGVSFASGLLYLLTFILAPNVVA